MQQNNEVLLKIILNSIKLSTIQEVDDYVVTIQSRTPKYTLPKTDCMTRCLLLYLLKNNFFNFIQNTDNLKHIDVTISMEQLLQIESVTELSPELKELLNASIKYGMTIISEEPKKLLSLIR